MGELCEGWESRDGGFCLEDWTPPPHHQSNTSCRSIEKLTGCVTLGNSLNFSVLQFPHLYYGNDNSTFHWEP